MSSAAIIAIAIGVAVVLAAIVFVTTARRSDVRGAGALSSETRRRDETARRARAAAEAGDEQGRRAQPRRQRRRRPHRRRGRARRGPGPPPDAGARPSGGSRAVGAARSRGDRRQPSPVLQPGHGHLTSPGIGAFAAAGFVAFLWPTATGGFGQVVNVGKLDDIKEGARGNSGFFYAPSARTWFTEYPGRCAARRQRPSTTSRPSRMRAYGVVALYQKCPHLGCRVPDCATSRWFECPCHGSQYNQVGEKKGGPAPRGMDRFIISVDGAGTSTSTPARHRRTAHRHQHHRPGGRRPPLHHRSRRTLMVRSCVPLAAGSGSLSDRAGGDVGCLVPRPRARHRVARLRGVQRPRGAQGAGLGDRARRQPQAVLRRRDAGRPPARARPVHRRVAARRHRRRAAAVLGVRAEPAGRRPGGRRTANSPAGAPSCSNRRPTAGSTAPAAMGA